MDRVIERWRQQPAAVQDVVFAVLLGVAWFGFAAAGEARGWNPRHEEMWDLAGAASVLVLALRRWAPAPLLAAVVLAYPLLYDVPLLSEFHLLPVLIAAYSAAWRPPLGAVTVAAASLAAGLLLSTGWLHVSPYDMPMRLDWSSILFGESAIAGMILLGVLAAAHRRATQTLAARNAELERLRTIEADQAVALERTRIARELHDDVAHHLTALIVRSQAADRVASTQPQVAVESMAWISETARYALTAMRRTVSVMREGDGPAQLAPGPTLADVPAVVARVRGTGLAVTLQVDDPLPPLDAQAQHAVVRIVQESLTNVLRHADAQHASVSLAATDDGVAVVVDDDGVGPRSGSEDGDGERTASAGHGLLGMQERTASCGGRFEVGRSDSGGWRVRGWFPAGATVGNAV